MTSRTGLQVITDSLKLLGVVAGHEVPTSAEQQDAFSRLNELIDSWGTHAHTMYLSRRDLLPLIVNKQTYTIGDSGNLDVPHPVALEAVSYLTATSPASEVFLAIASDQAWQGVSPKTLTGTPAQVVTYTQTVPLGELWVWPIPTVAQTLALYWTEPVQQFPDLVTPVALAAGYAKALRTNLAVELAPEFGRTVDPVIAKLAAESLADIKRQNMPYIEIGLDPGLPGVEGAGYNILTDH